MSKSMKNIGKGKGKKTTKKKPKATPKIKEKPIENSVETTIEEKSNDYPIQKSEIDELKSEITDLEGGLELSIKNLDECQNKCFKEISEKADALTKLSDATFEIEKLKNSLAKTIDSLNHKDSIIKGMESQIESLKSDRTATIHTALDLGGLRLKLDQQKIKLMKLYAEELLLEWKEQEKPRKKAFFVNVAKKFNVSYGTTMKYCREIYETNMN